MQRRIGWVCTILMSLSLSGCVDMSLPTPTEFERTRCEDPNDPDAQYFYASEASACASLPTSFYLKDNIYCCLKPPVCSDYGKMFYLSGRKDATSERGTAECTDIEAKTAKEDGISNVKIVMKNSRICCYHPSCSDSFGANYVLSGNSGADDCKDEVIEIAQKFNMTPQYELKTGEKCCYQASVLPLDGPNCDSGWITLSDAEVKQCVYEFDENAVTFNDDEDDEDDGDSGYDGDESDDDSSSSKSSDDVYYCKSGRLEGRFCRMVPPEKHDSRVNIQFGQLCSDEQLNPGTDTVRIHVMDIGQGDSIWIQTPDGKNVLIDGGDGNAFNTQSGPIISDYLTNHGFPEDGTFDAVILTHPHSDHFGGFLSLFSSSSKYKIKNYLDPMDLNTGEYVPSNYKKWISRVKAIVTNGDHIYMPAEEKFKAGDSFPEEFFGSSVKTEYIYSSKYIGKTESKANPNTASIIFRLTYKDVSMLFTGDAEAAQEDKAVATNLVTTNFLKVCHHGSNTSSSPGFLDAIWKDVDQENRYAVISSGRRTFSKAYIPHAEILTRILEYVDLDHLFSTSAGDDDKHESQTYRDDNVLIVIDSSGKTYACYSGTN